MRPMEAMPTSNSMVFFHTKQLLVKPKSSWGRGQPTSLRELLFCVLLVPDTAGMLAQ
jgi:hypothetical protein